MISNWVYKEPTRYVKTHTDKYGSAKLIKHET
jgi:hypothetical protein